MEKKTYAARLVGTTMHVITVVSSSGGSIGLWLVGWEHDLAKDGISVHLSGFEGRVDDGRGLLGGGTAELLLLLLLLLVVVAVVINEVVTTAVDEDGVLVGAVLLLLLIAAEEQLGGQMAAKGRNDIVGVCTHVIVGIHMYMLKCIVGEQKH